MRTGYSCSLVLLLAGAGLFIAGQDRAPQPGRRAFNTREFLGLGPAPDPVAAARGEKLYEPNCAFCHGQKGRGAEGPSLVRSTVVLHDEKGELIGPVIAQGRADRGMPAFARFTPEQLHDLAEYLHMQVELVANRGTYKRLNIVTGDPKAGEAYFRGAGGCQSCHSATGDLAHIASKYTQADQLQNRFVWPGAQQPPAKVTVTLGSGESIHGTLKRMDDFDVSLYDTSGAYRSWPRREVEVKVEDRLAGHRKLLERYTDADIHNLTAWLVTLK
jgi:mono/diheme cytochrome c family protein